MADLDDAVAHVRAGVAALEPADTRGARSRTRFLAELDRLLRAGQDPFSEHPPDRRREAPEAWARTDRRREAPEAWARTDRRREAPEAWAQDLDLTHVTASAIVVGARGVVLHRHKDLGVWMQPGGHIEPGEHPWEAAAREAGEETGLAVALAEPPRIVHVDVHEGGRGHTHLDVRYLLTAGDADPAPPPGESPEAAWFAWDEAVALADPGLVGALRLLRPAVD